VRAWAKRHDYGYSADHLQEFPNRPPSWAKVPSLLERLANPVLWVDADCIVSQPSDGLESRLPAGVWDAVFCVDPLTRFSAGVMYLQPTVKKLLRGVYADPDWASRELCEQESLDRMIDRSGLRWTVAPKLAGNLWHWEFRRAGRTRTDKYFDGSQLFCHVSGVRYGHAPHLAKLSRIIRQQAAKYQ